MAANACINNGEIRHVLQSQAKARALRYDNLRTVLTNLDQHVQKPAKRKRDKDSAPDPTEIAELRAELASQKAENERLAERFAEEFDRLADRLAELEVRAHRPAWWRRLLGLCRQEPEPAGRARRKAVARLRALKLSPVAEPPGAVS
jgi:hypothetical protein